MSAFIREPCDESIILSRPATAPCPKSSGRWVLAATTLASSMAFIDGTVVNVALRAQRRDLARRCWFRVVSQSLAAPFRRANADAPLALGQGLVRSPPLLGQ